MIDAKDAAGPMRGPGLLVACKFGCEDAAVREVQRALGELHGTGKKITLSTSAATLEDGNASDRSDDTAAKGEGRSMSIEEHARRIAVAHKGLAWLRYDGTSQKHSPRDDETVDEGFPGKMANTRADAVEAFAALVGRRDVPAAALKSCQYIFPVSSCVAATEEALEAAVATECDAAVRDPSSKLSASSCRVAVAVHTRGDDSRAASANGAPPLARVVARDAALRALMNARSSASLPPATLDLHAPEIVVLITQWRIPTAGDRDGPNEPVCGVSIMAGDLADVRAKNIAPRKPSAHKRPSATTATATKTLTAEKKKKPNQWKPGDRSAGISKADKVYDADFSEHRPLKAEVPPARTVMSDDEATRLFDAAVDKRVKAGLFRVRGEGVSNSTISNNLERLRAGSAAGLALRLVHGTGDGFDGATADLLGPAVLVEQHRRWACVDPLLRAVTKRLGDKTPVYLKRRWSKAPGERGGCLVSGVPVSGGGEGVDGALAAEARRAADEAAAKEGKDTHRDRVVVREPGDDGLKFGLWLTGEEHVGVFLDSRPARELVRRISNGKRVLNLFSYTGGFGAAASAGGATCSHNVDAKTPCLAAAKVNYALNGLPHEGDWRAFQRKDVVRFLAMTARSEVRYDLVVVDPPPRFSRNSDWAFEAERHTGQLLAMCVEVCADTGAGVLIGSNALAVSDARFEEMIVEAEELSGRSLVAKEWVGAGEDFPPCPYRPAARFALLDVGDAPEGGVARDKGQRTTIAEELGARDEGGSGGDDTDGFETANDDEVAGDESPPGESPPPPQPPEADFACLMCAHPFPSRNKLFRHYNDATEACGAWCASHGGVAAAAELVNAGKLERPTFDPPDFAEKSGKVAKQSGAERRGGKQRRRGNAATEDANRREASDAELWVGGLHGEHAYPRALKRLVHAAIPGSSGIDQPIVRLVVRKGWRERGTGRWIGYGFVRFRDREEANAALPHIDGASPAEGVSLVANFAANPKLLPGVGQNRESGREPLSRVKSDSAFESSADGSAYGSACGDSDADAGADADADNADADADDDGPVAPGRDPSHLAVARAWPKRTLAARARAAGLPSVDAYLGAVADGSNHPRRAELTARALRFSRGAPVPEPLLANLRVALETARWPPVSHRPKVDSERYLVLRREVLGANDPRSDVVDPYAELKSAANAVLEWADPGFEYDHLAITRNFVGSPHVDGEDKSHQYALALGDYGQGGELCVESEDGATRWVVDTRDSIARVDGRCAHWVRGWRDFGANARYSVIYYVTRPRCATALSFAVDEGWSPGDGAIAGAGSAAPASDGSIDVAALSLCTFRSVEAVVGSAVRVAGALFPWPRAMETAWEAFASVLPSEGRWWLIRLA